MTTDQAGYKLIEQFEGLTLTVKGDAGGKQEIGYGHDLLPGEAWPDGITQAQAQELLIEDVGQCEIAVDRLGWPLTQNQYNALIDFSYECGVTALMELASHGQSQVTTQLPRWVHAHVNGQLVELPGMVARRAAEVKLYNT